jgi:hypothetical protein
MILETNPTTKGLHNFWETKIKKKFPTLKDISPASLLLFKYIENSPEKFYDLKAYTKYLQYLEKMKDEDPTLLISILKEVNKLLDLSYKILGEINKDPIHDILLPERNDLFDFVDKKIHYNLLRVYESPFYHFGYIIVKYSWVKMGKQIDGLNLSETVRDLNAKGFEISDQIYLHNVRNAIAHGKIKYISTSIVYEDKKGNSEYDPKSIIKAFDQMLDITNGFSLAFKIFSFKHKSFLENNGISLPLSILLDELSLKATCPAWEIRSSLEQLSSDGHRQLNLYIKNDFWDYSKILLNSFYTAYWAERLTNCYDRIFISLHSTHAQTSVHGWAAFDAIKLRYYRERKVDLSGYKDVLENNGVYFFPKIKFPKFIYKIGTYHSIVKSLFPVYLKNFRDILEKKDFTVRDSLIHSKGRYAAIQTASVVINSEFEGDVISLIRNKRKEIAKAVINFSRAKCSSGSLVRYQRVKYIRLSIYDSNKRLRNLHYSGTIPELIATIEVNTTNKIKSVDMINSVAEQIGIHRIAWHQNWRGLKK